MQFDFQPSSRWPARAAFSGPVLRGLCRALFLATLTTVAQAEEARVPSWPEWLRLPTLENLPNKYQRTTEYYAQLNIGSFHTDNGVETSTQVEDNDASQSRIGFNINWVYPDSGKLLFNFETGLGVRGSSDGRISGETTSIDIGTEDFRHLEFIYTSPYYGKFYFGQGSMATDGAAYSDLSGTTIASYAGIADFAGDVEFSTKDEEPADIIVGDVFQTYDGPRRFRFRYDTPAYKGLTLSLATGRNLLNKDDDNKYHDIGLRYDKDYGDVLVKAAMGFTRVDNQDSLITGSMSALHKSSGISFAVAAGTPQDANARYIFAKLGYQGDWFRLGNTAVSVDVYRGENFRAKNADSLTYAVGLVQRIKRFERVNVDVYASYRTYRYDASGADLNDIDLTLIGVRLKF